MLANLLSVLDKNADVLWLCGVLLALAFRRNRYTLALLVLGVPMFMPGISPGIQLAVATLVLVVAWFPEPRLVSLHSLTLLGSALVLPFIGAWLPSLALMLDAAAAPSQALAGSMSWPAWTLVAAALGALFRWLRRGWPLDLYFALAMIPAVVALSADPPQSMRAWLAATAAGIAIAVLYGAYRMAFIDALTGLPNRRALDERLARSQGRIAIGMVDIDHFKRFNDRYGHESGDRVLREVARQLRHCPGGTAYRYGGEEFSIVFDGRRVQRAGESLEIVRAAVEGLRVRLRKGGSSGNRAQAVRRGQNDGEVGVTISIGLAERDPERRTCGAVVDAADKALYRSKQRGRNRLTLAGAARS
jgi:diguanylate cyclase (GGDEF)-like protein